MWEGVDNALKSKKSKEPTTGIFLSWSSVACIYILNFFFPILGFQLFSSRAQSQTEIHQENKVFDPEIDLLSETILEENITATQCVSKFDFTRIEGMVALGFIKTFILVRSRSVIMR